MRFTPWKLIGGLLIVVPTAITSAAVYWLFPNEEAPRIENLANGSTAYHFVSLRLAAMPSVVLILLIIFTFVAVRVMPRRAFKESGQERRHWFWGCLLVALLCLAVWVLLYWIVWLPYSRIRTIVVHPKLVELRSVLWSWDTPIADIVHVGAHRVNTVKYRQPRVRIYFEVATKAATYRTLELSLEKTDPELARYTEWIDRLKSQLAGLQKGGQPKHGD